MGRTIGCSSSSISRVMGICLDLFLGPSKGPIKGKGKASGKTTAIATRKTGTRGAKRQIRGLEGRSGRYGVSRGEVADTGSATSSNRMRWIYWNGMLFWLSECTWFLVEQVNLRAVAHPQPSGSAGASKLPICHSSGHAGSAGASKLHANLPKIFFGHASSQGRDHEDKLSNQ